MSEDRKITPLDPQARKRESRKITMLRVQGRTAEAARRLTDYALALESAGAFPVILGCVPRKMARLITARLRVPTISYGAGVRCDGQGMVSADMLGLFDRFKPKFAKCYVSLAPQILKAFETYRDKVVGGRFPADEHTYAIDPQELAAPRGKAQRTRGKR